MIKKILEWLKDIRAKRKKRKDLKKAYEKFKKQNTFTYKNF